MCALLFFMKLGNSLAYAGAASANFEAATKMTNEQWDVYCRNLNTLREFFERPEVREILSEPPTLTPRSNGSIYANLFLLTEDDPRVSTEKLITVVGNCSRKDYEDTNFPKSAISFRLPRV